MGMNLCLSDLLCKQIECDLLMNTLGEWMNSILIDWGISNSIADRIDEVLIALLISALAVGLDYVCQFLFVWAGSARGQFRGCLSGYIRYTLGHRPVRSLVHHFPFVGL